MKLLKRLLIVVVVLLILFFVGASVYVNLYGKDFIEGAMQSSLGRDVVIGKISFQFPMNLRARNVRISHRIKGKKFFETQDIIAQLSIDTIFHRQLVLNSVELIKPVIVIEKISGLNGNSSKPERRHGIVIPPKRSDLANASSASSGEKNRGEDRQTKISIKRLIIKQGSFQYRNSLINKDFSFAMENVYLKAHQLVFPVEAGKTIFDISGRLIKEGNPLSGSTVEGNGWVDIVQRDMEVQVEVIEADGSVGMTAKAVSKDNDMEVKGEIKFRNILMGADKGDSKEPSVVNDLISSALSSARVEIGAKFSFKTKMDDFRPQRVSFSGNVVTR